MQTAAIATWRRVGRYFNKRIFVTQQLPGFFKDRPTIIVAFFVA